MWGDMQQGSAAGLEPQTLWLYSVLYIIYIISLLFAFSKIHSNFLSFTQIIHNFFISLTQFHTLSPSPSFAHKTVTVSLNLSLRHTAFLSLFLLCTKLSQTLSKNLSSYAQTLFICLSHLSLTWKKMR